MKVVAFGEVMMRMMPPDYKTLTQSNILEYCFTGTGVNVLSGLYQMQDEVYLCTTLPNNAVGKAAASAIRKLGINDQFLRFKGEHIGVYFLEKGFGNRASKVTYLNRKNSSFSLSDEQDYDIQKILQDADCLHICGIALAINENTRRCALSFAKQAKKLKIPVIFDCNFRASLWDQKDLLHARSIYEQMMNYADYVFANEKDGLYTFGLTSEYEIGTPECRVDILTKMKAKYNLMAIAGTIRQQDHLQGFMLDKDGYLTSEQMTLTVFDRIGGGDAFAAGMIHAWFHFIDRSQQIQYATCSGVLGHTTYGDSPILSKDDIMEFMLEGAKDVKR